MHNRKLIFLLMILLMLTGCTRITNNLDGVGVKPDVCTFEMLENKDIANLLKQQNGSCMAESREDTNFEENVALFMLKQNL